MKENACFRAFVSRHDHWLAAHERIYNFSETAATKHAVQTTASGYIFFAMACEVHDDVARVRAAKYKPRIALIA